METDVSTDYYGGGLRETNNGSMMMDPHENYRMSTMSSQTPNRNRVSGRGGQGSRNSQP